jgi:hypothetical protein
LRGGSRAFQSFISARDDGTGEMMICREPTITSSCLFCLQNRNQ